jgi:hypothetical protein
MRKQWVVAFKDSGDKYAEPEIFICSAEEAAEVQELLDTVCNEGDGVIDSLSYKEFTFQAEPITLAELRSRFEDQLAGLEEGDNECSGCGCEDHQGEGCPNCADFCNAEEEVAKG